MVGIFEDTRSSLMGETRGHYFITHLLETNLRDGIHYEMIV
jgi:hypothetical protein